MCIVVSYNLVMIIKMRSVWNISNWNVVKCAVRKLMLRPQMLATKRKGLKNTENDANISVNSVDSQLGLEITRLRSTVALNAIIKNYRQMENNVRKSQTILIEGQKFIAEALECNIQLRALIFSKMEQLRSLDQGVLQHLQAKTSANIYKVSHHDLKIWSALQHPPGILGIFDRPDIAANAIANINNNSLLLPITIVCDNIRDPYNLGSIIRTSAALSCRQILLMHGCCNAWQTKALRGSCGAHFRIPIEENVAWNNLSSIFLDNSGKSLDCYVLLAESNLNKENNRIELITLDNLQSELPYSQHIIVMIGGEVHGLSRHAYETLPHLNSKCVHIPLSNGVDSLNAASALALILYKLKECIDVRQVH